jgi:hypothetical protein
MTLLETTAANDPALPEPARSPNILDHRFAGVAVFLLFTAGIWFGAAALP